MYTQVLSTPRSPVEGAGVKFKAPEADTKASASRSKLFLYTLC